MHTSYNRYDSVAQENTRVLLLGKNKKEAPALEGRKISVEQIAKTIENPNNKESSLSTTDPNKFGWLIVMIY